MMWFILILIGLYFVTGLMVNILEIYKFLTEKED